MKLICAGYPKTGSKSCSSALRKLGYNVADYMETLEFLPFIWKDYNDGKATIDDVIAEYEKHGFDTNQDIPGNLLWEDLYRGMLKRDKNTKVILTVRDNDAVWWKSWCGFVMQEAERHSFCGLSSQGLMSLFGVRGYMGPEIQALSVMAKEVIADHLDPVVAYPGLTVQQQIDSLTKKEHKIRTCYLKHNLYVQSIVPKENLLIWNLKEGWEPLCKFLGKEIPDGPIPHDNKTGDKKFMEEYAWKSEFFKKMAAELNKNLAIGVVKVGLLAYVGYKEYKSGGKWLASNAKYLQEIALRLKDLQ